MPSKYTLFDDPMEPQLVRYSRIGKLVLQRMLPGRKFRAPVGVSASQSLLVMVTACALSRRLLATLTISLMKICEVLAGEATLVVRSVRLLIWTGEVGAKLASTIKM